jgi:hypothetical protein
VTGRLSGSDREFLDELRPGREFGGAEALK